MHTSQHPWLPEWRDETKYTELLDAKDVSRWAWEFLRRNGEYLADVEHFNSLPHYDENGNRWPELPTEEVDVDGPACLRFCDPPCEPGETIAEWEGRTGDAIGPPLRQHLEEKWMIQGLPHPESTECPKPIDDPRLPYRADDDAPELAPYGCGDLLVGLYDRAIPVPPGRMMISVNPELPWKKQNREIELIINEEKSRRRAKGPHDRNILRMLRALDGHTQGATSREIAQVLFPAKDAISYADSGVKTAEYLIKRAKRFVDSPYKLLLF